MNEKERDAQREIRERTETRIEGRSGVVLRRRVAPEDREEYEAVRAEASERFQDMARRADAEVRRGEAEHDPDTGYRESITHGHSHTRSKMQRRCNALETALCEKLDRHLKDHTHAHGGWGQYSAKSRPRITRK